ncbi:unnamed protein product [Plasmodium vivax]|uniref:(malaria parasite P. vivax) hypothetical protein n=1 Tax=Plasmodium vivax TaxID=5855 RepID=A0A8S4HK53_PLAVI|nr:unnamed protein product [Plasmodium vivax]
MSLEHHERYCPLNRFIGRIRDFNYNNQNFSTIPDLNDIVAENNVALTNIGCAVYRGYTYLAPHNNGDERRDFCNYLNLWLDEQKTISATDNSDDIREKWVLIENLWDKLYEIEDPSRQCERKSKENNASKIKKRMNLMVYCINRNYFKDLCEKSISRKNNVNQTCSLFSEFTNKYYANFYDENKCFDYPLGTDNYGYYISEDCDLNNIAKTFPKFDSNLQSILENDNVRPTMKKCRIHSEVEDEHIEQTEDGAYVPPEHSEPDNALPGSEVDLTESVFHLLPSSEVNLTDNGPSKPVYYAGLSALGVVFTSTVLYKYTTLGPLIRSLVSKKEKLRQTTNKHLAQQWLQTASEYMDSNSENSHYNFPYQSMQN